MAEFKLEKSVQDKLEQRIIRKLISRELPIFFTKSVSTVLPEIINKVRSAIPTPQDGKDAKITDEMLSDLVVKVLEKTQELIQVKDGQDGQEGSQGDKGDRGEKGELGDRGSQGLIGNDGSDGRDGRPGVSGPIGIQGQKGNTGKIGPIGLLGETGSSGSDGKDGADGQSFKVLDEDLDRLISRIKLPSAEKDIEKAIKELKENIRRGRVKLPFVGGGGMTPTEIVNAINRILDTEDWQNGNPGDGSIGHNAAWVNFTKNFAGSVPDEAGVAKWNDAELALDINTGIGPVLQVGQEIYILIYNDSISQIDNMTPVRPLSAVMVGDLVVPTVEDAHSDVFSGVEGTLMIATMDIPPDTIGLATRFGKVRGGDTSSFSPGDGLWIAPSGGLQNTRPEFPDYDISVGGVLKADVDGEIIVSFTRDIFDTTLNFWNGTFRETINFTVESSSGVITGTLQPDNGHIDMTMMFSDGFSMLDTSPPLTIVLTAGTADDPQTNFVYVPKSTKVLTISTSDWPTTEHIKVANIVLRTADLTESDGALGNRNWNDHIENTTTFQGHLSHIGEKLRQFEAQWDSGSEGSATGFPSNVYVSTTAGVIYQLHKQPFPSFSMPTDDIHVVNNFADPYVTVSNLNTQTLDALGVTLANASFSFVVWGLQNKAGQISHIMCNLPIDTYSKNSPESAVSDASNFSVYDIPKQFQGVGFLIARFTMVLEANGTTWSLFDTEDLRGKVPNTTAGGGGGGGGTTFAGLSDTPSSYSNFVGKSPVVNEAETGLEFVDGLTVVNSETYTILSTDVIVHSTYSTTGPSTIELPTALTLAGKEIRIVDGSGNAKSNNIIIQTEGSQVIVGKTTYDINTDYGSVWLYSDGANWFITSEWKRALIFT